MSKFFSFFIILLSLSAKGQNSITSLEYWFDNDILNKQSIPVAPLTTISLSTSIDVSSQIPGLHVITFRAVNDSGYFSVPFSKTFYLGGGLLTGYEYWFDTDYNNKIVVNSSGVSFIEDSITMNIAQLDHGFHTLNFRTFNSNLLSSSIVTRQFFISTTEIKGYEYWFNNDVSSKVVVPATGQMIDVSSNISVSTLPPGIHTISMRSFADSNIFSVPYSKAFYIGGGQLTGYEYWFDTDYNNKTIVNSSGVSFIEDSITMNIAQLDHGFHTLNFRTFNSNLLSSSIVTRQFFKSTTEIKGYEYWFNNDVASKVVVPATGQLIDVSSNISVSSLPPGIHTITMRSFADSNIFSVPFSKTFYIGGGQLTGYEYWFDTDYSGKTTVNVTGTAFIDESLSLSVASLSPGLHTISLRGFNGSLLSSNIATRQFFVSNGGLVTSLEYWFDSNFQGRTSQSFAPAQSHLINQSLDLSAFDPGFHLLHFRAKDTSGIWSVVKSQLFLKNSIQNQFITGYEYWFDQNFSNRINRSIIPSVNPIINEALDASALTNGLHWVYIRTKDSTGFYSSPISALIAKVDFLGTNNEITGYEYWFNSDFANRVSQNTTSAGNVVLLTNLSTTSLADGLNRVNFRFKDKANQWSIVYTQEFEKTDSANQNNLIINPSCDLPLVNSKIPFWTEVGVTGWTRGSSNPSPFDGPFYFNPPSSASAELKQEVNLSQFKCKIDQGTQQFRFKGYVRSRLESPSDQSTVTIEWKDSSGLILQTYNSGPIANTTTWQLIDTLLNSPILSRNASVRLISTRLTGTTNDGLFDELSLISLTNVPCNLSSGISIQGDTVFCQGGQIQLTASLACDTTSVSYLWQGPNGFTASTKTISISNTTTLNSGLYILTITNICGEIAKDTLNVLVKGIGTYGIICPVNKTISTSSGSCSASNVLLGTPIVNDNCTGAVLTNNAPSLYLPGITQVKWMIVNTANDTAACIQTIIVADSIPPVINNCPSQVYTTNPVVWNTITATDNCGPVTLSSNYQQGDTLPFGQTLVSYTATDSSGNISSCSFNVNIVPSCTQVYYPTNGATGVPLSTFLGWAVGDSGTTGYTIFIGQDTINLTQYTTNSTTYQINLQSNKTYYWKVVPFNAYGPAQNCSFSSFQTFVCTQASITPSGNYSLCEGAYITAIASMAEAYQWSNGDTNQTVQISSAGNYSVTVIDSNGCQSTSPTLNITLQPKVRIVANGPTAICAGAQLTLSASHSATQYNWSTGSNAASIVVSPTVNTWYYLTGTTSGGCTINDSILVMVNQGQAVPVSAMFPINGTSNLSTSVFVSWLPGNPTGNNVYDIFIWPSTASQPSIPSKSNYNGVNYTFSGLVPATTYNWRIKTKNGCSEANGPISSFSTSQLPDLIVNSISAPSIAYSGTTISVSWQVTNMGLGATGANTWIDNVYLSTDTIYHPALDFFIGSSSNQSALLNNQSYSATINSTLLNTISGNYYVIIISDAQTGLLESNESNNVKINTTPVGILLSPVPDLRVSSVINQSNAFSSTPATPVDIPIQYTVKNQGDNGILNKTWFDDFYISNSPFFDPQNATFLGQLLNKNKTVLADSSYTNTATIRVPYYVNGMHFFYVRTDVDNSLFEGPFENNNINSNSINIILSPPPDLQTTTLTCPDTINLYQNITSVWTVLNAGPGIAAGGWKDKIYFSNDSADWNLNHATLLSTYSHTSVLNNLSIYSASSNFMIPDSVSGIRYLYAHTDADSTVFEFTNEHNNVGKKATPIVIRKPDISIVNGTVPSNITVGQPFSTNYTVKSNGPAPVYASTNRRDVIVLSNDAVYSIYNDDVISSIVYNDALPIDSTKIINRTLTMPSLPPGNYHVFIVTDPDNTINENNEGNNIYSAGTIQVSLPQAPDLSTLSMSFVPDTIVTRSSQSLNASVRNIGPGVASGQWSDELFISKDSVWNSSTAISLQLIPQNKYLNPNNIYSNNYTFTIPSISILGGIDSTHYYFWHRVDVNNAISEQAGENNNITKSKRVFLRDSIITLPPVDLKPTGISIMDTLNAGAPGNLSWTVQNLGPGNLSGKWSDEVYLSLDTVLGGTDIQIVNFSVNRQLNALASYTQNRNFTLSSVLSGSYFIFVKTNSGNAISHETNYSNNIWLAKNVSNNPVKVVIKPIIPVDLQSLSFNAPTNVIAGQPYYVHYTFINNGPETISNKNITNSIRLGSSPNVLTSAIVGNNTINITLAPAQILTDSIQVIVPIPINGVFYWGIIIDDLSIIPETNESNNSQVNILTATTPPPADLIVGQITMPDSASADSSITINWKIKNNGYYSASGVINEGIYISKDRSWDVNDPLLRNFTTNVNIAPQGEISNQATVSLTEALNGFQHIIIKTDLLNYIVESNDSNNTGISADSIYINVRELPLNLWVSDSLKNTKRLTYKIIIPDSLEGKALQVKLKGDSTVSENKLFLRFNNVPDQANFDVASISPGDANQEVIVQNTIEGEYYLSVYGNSNYQGTNAQPVQLYATILPFSITNVDANKGGNTGTVTIKIEGALFTNNMQVKLKPVLGGNAIVSHNVSFVNSGRIFARFDLRQKPIGLYDVELTKVDSSTATLNDGFSIEQGNSGGFYVGGITNSGQSGSANAPGCDPGAGEGINQLLQIDVNSPSFARINTPLILFVNFGNAGNTDIPIPTKFLISENSVALALSPLDLIKNEEQLYLEFRELNGPTDVLRAGATGSIQIFTGGLPAGISRFVIK